jgi:hypothetical protein
LLIAVGCTVAIRFARASAKMAGVVLETLSNRKLIAFGVVALLCQIGFVLIGGLIGECNLVFVGLGSGNCRAIAEVDLTGLIYKCY